MSSTSTEWFFFFFNAQTSATQTFCLKDTHKLTIKHEHIGLNAHQLPVLCKTEKISRINTAIITSASFFLTHNHNPFCSSRSGLFVFRFRGESGL